MRRRCMPRVASRLSGAQPEDKEKPLPHPPPRSSGEGAEISMAWFPRGAGANAPLPTRLLSGRALPARRKKIEKKGGAGELHSSTAPQAK